MGIPYINGYLYEKFENLIERDLEKNISYYILTKKVSSNNRFYSFFEDDILYSKAKNILKKEFEDYIKEIKNIINSNYKEEYKEQAENLPDDWENSDDYFQYIEETKEILINDLLENNYFHDVHLAEEKIHWNSYDERIRKLTDCKNEIEKLANEIIDFLHFKTLNKNDLIICLFDDEYEMDD